MSRGVNKTILVGHLGNDPEMRAMPSGKAVANISVATSEQWRDKDTGEKQSRPEWHRVVFFDRLAEVVGQYLKKGSQVYVEGKLRTRKWSDKDGNDRWSTEIVAHEMQMLGGRPGGESPSQKRAADNGYSGPTPSNGHSEPYDDFGEDVPF